MMEKVRKSDEVMNADSMLQNELNDVGSVQMAGTEGHQSGANLMNSKTDLGYHENEPIERAVSNAVLEEDEADCASKATLGAYMQS